MPEDKPTNTSSDYDAMFPYWETVAAMRDGVKGMRKGGEKYLPRLPDEPDSEYEYRLKTSRFTNIFRDIIENLAAKPFAEEASIIPETASQRVLDISENIDGQGNNFSIFAAKLFLDGIADAIQWILVDYTKNVPENLTIEQERQYGARPYWAKIDPRSLIAVYSTFIGGEEVIVHVRMLDNLTIREGFSEKTIERVRVFNRELLYVDDDPRNEVISASPATWEVWEKVTKENSREEEWEVVESGNISIGIIPLVPFLIGERVNPSSWAVDPPMQGAVDLQRDYYEDQTGLKAAKVQTCYPMLAANGIRPTLGTDGRPEPIRVGPKTVLYGEGQGRWEVVEPSATSLQFLASENKETVAQLRELGRQPLTAQTGNLTVITTAFAAQKGNSAVRAWALRLKDALENALKITVMWLKEQDEPEVHVYTDFDIENDNGSDVTALTESRKNGDLSLKTYLKELKRRNIVGPDFDVDEEIKAILDEEPDEPELPPLMVPPVNPAEPNNPESTPIDTEDPEDTPIEE